MYLYNSCFVCFSSFVFTFPVLCRYSVVSTFTFAYILTYYSQSHSHQFSLQHGFPAKERKWSVRLIRRVSSHQGKWTATFMGTRKVISTLQSAPSCKSISVFLWGCIWQCYLFCHLHLHLLLLWASIHSLVWCIHVIWQLVYTNKNMYAHSRENMFYNTLS